ncbi:hypothetical protein ZIOFF_075013 [Zingiber officinale]|uniref:Uncharacterized protein n=1 Tax=Zingiber officinale TaxID=94328 RepID=A0A8J5E8S8_ZINOF|nr:hypothetical protein ZIOFF_075013 [Zingiber officinale]
MEKKQGFLSALEEVVRALSPARTRPKSPSARSQCPTSATLRLLPRRLKGHGRQQLMEQQSPELQLIAQSESFRPQREVLAPLAEGPQSDEPEDTGGSRREGRGRWVWGQLARPPSAKSSAAATSFRRSDLRLLLGVMAAPLAPVYVNAGDSLRPHLSIKGTPIETSSAQYILQQYTAASGGVKLQSTIRNAYAMGKSPAVSSSGRWPPKCGTSSSPLAEARSAAARTASSSGGTPWLGTHAAKGPVRPLRRAIQGLDPLTTASMFAGARCIGERTINGEDLFVLKLCADPQTLNARSDGPAEIIRHVLFGYFSQRTGLLIRIEDSHLTRIQSNAAGDSIYWETTIDSFLDDYRPVEGVMIAHSGRSVVTLFRFGEMAMSHTKTRMEEAWTIEEVAFNVAGLSADCFIPPADIRRRSISETRELPHCERGRASNRAKLSASDHKRQRASDAIVRRVEV